MNVFRSHDEKLSSAAQAPAALAQPVQGSLAGMDSVEPAVRVTHLYVSAGHNYFGHHDQPAGTHAIVAQAEVECVAGRGIAGDRFFDYKPDYKGQITFFAGEVFDSLCAALGACDKSPAALRRNVIIRGMDLTLWYEREFEVQGVRFLGMGECKPCYWMNQAIGPGAENALKGRGGLRAKILSSGRLVVDGALAR